MPQRLLRLRGGRVLRDGALVEDDVWVDRVKGRVVDPMALFYAAGGDTEGLYKEYEELDCRGRIVAPGLVDLQFNGGFGLDFSNVRDMTDAEGAARLLECRRQLLRTGVTSFCPTLISLRPDEYRALIPLLQESCGLAAGGCASMLGLHLEGPFFSPDKIGAHPAGNIRTPKEVGGSAEAVYGPGFADQSVRLLTLAPEVDGAADLIGELAARPYRGGGGLGDIERYRGRRVLSIGHSAANHQEAQTAVRRGARMITHLFNAMGAFHHRDPGIIGLLGSPAARLCFSDAAVRGQPAPEPAPVPAQAQTRAPAQAQAPVSRSLADEAVLYYGIIADGLHAHPSSVSMAVHSHPDGAVLVTDAMSGMCLRPGRYRLGAQEVEIAMTASMDDDGTPTARAVLAGTDTLAGAVVPMNLCVRNFSRFTGVDTAQALQAATLHPARAIGLDKVKGSLCFGADADIVLLDDDLTVHATFVKGKLCYEREAHGDGEEELAWGFAV